jgi:hypothetical protein
MKTPEEIKKGLECSSNCSDQGIKCRECPYQPLDCPYLHADALAYIKHLEAQVPRWIPVEERLPEKHKIVLVFKRRTAHFIWSDATWSIETDWCGEDGWSKTPHNGCFAVTHWMHLPEPPKEE